jgi:hypothetical protein
LLDRPQNDPILDVFDEQDTAIHQAHAPSWIDGQVYPAISRKSNASRHDQPFEI